MGKRSHDKRVENFVFTHHDIFDQIRAELKARGPLGNRDFAGQSVGKWNYRGRKETSLALFDMWLSGELMIHHRDRFSRFYDFLENVAPPEFHHVAPEKEAEEYFARKAIAFMGLLREASWKIDIQDFIRRKIEPIEMRVWLGRWIEQELAVPIRVEGRSDKFLVLGEDIPLLESLEAGKTPKAWKPIGPTTLDEVSFLAPLDIVSARGRAKKLFDFEYLWEVYKPVHLRRWGYYTLPILYGDDLVARLDPKLDRTTMTLQIKGFWHEDDTPVKNPAFVSAFAKGLVRFAEFLGAKKIEIAAIHPPRLRMEVKEVIKGVSELAVK